ncbi:rod shape-determining protein MreD [Anaerotignum neopropionicum]|uniref:Rod shape-determining protein MreD n=1 Tax=Anaerotignum neopropionicum TaxID=36847 RepID=A0A136WI42_9FIRM|nr:rod shape-determining protein MreD [Anaerotignum neopropionicum]KXL54050.1 rod shape-determining protein MreD [Anaerotignum neopropionicum]
MRIIITIAMVLINFILQTTLLQHLAIQSIFPNTALIIVVSYALLRGSKEGCIVGAFTGLLFDVFFGTAMGYYTLLYFALSYFTGKSQKNFYRENYLLPILFCALAAGIFEFFQFLTELVLRKDGNILFFVIKIFLPTIVYTAVVTVPIYRILFGLNEWLELKEKYKYRLF